MGMRAKRSLSLEGNSGDRAPNIQIVGLAAPVRHALQALAALAAAPERCQDAGALSKRLSLPAAALSKSFQTLARSGLLKSRRGPGGGYRLARDPKTVNLSQVAAALGMGEERRGRCLLGERPCRREDPCLLHSSALEADRLLMSALTALTLADLAADDKKAGRPV